MAKIESNDVIKSPSKLAAIIINCYGDNPPSGEFRFNHEELIKKAAELYGEETARTMVTHPAVWDAAHRIVAEHFGITPF